jgi:hypothetical protein
MSDTQRISRSLPNNHFRKQLAKCTRTLNDKLAIYPTSNTYTYPRFSEAMPSALLHDQDSLFVSILCLKKPYRGRKIHVFVFPTTRVVPLEDPSLPALIPPLAPNIIRAGIPDAVGDVSSVIARVRISRRNMTAAKKNDKLNPNN